METEKYHTRKLSPTRSFKVQKREILFGKLLRYNYLNFVYSGTVKSYSVLTLPKNKTLNGLGTSTTEIQKTLSRRMPRSMKYFYFLLCVSSWTLHYFLSSLSVLPLLKITFDSCFQVFHFALS